MFVIDACSAVSGRVSNSLRSSSTAREISKLSCHGLTFSCLLSFSIAVLYLHDMDSVIASLSIKFRFPKAESAGTCCVSRSKTATRHSRQLGERRST